MKTTKTNVWRVLVNRKIFYSIVSTITLLLITDHKIMAQGSNTRYGTDALLLFGGNENSAYGNQAMRQNVNGGGNTALGAYTLYTNNGGEYNTAVGYRALQSNSTASSNTAVGFDALFSNKTGVSNVAIGVNSLRTNAASYNTAAGFNALLNNSSGEGNVANGAGALANNISGHYNVAAGFNAIYSNSTGNYNTAMGPEALYSNTAGTANAAVGYRALYSATGSYNAALGYNADVAAGFNNSTAIGYSAKVNASNAIQLGNNAITKIYAGVGTAATVVAGGLQITGGTPAVGKVLTSIDANGSAIWQDPASVSWSLTGNLGTVDGTHFIGTIDNVPFNIRVNNQKAGRIDANNAFYGYQSGNARTTGGFNTANGYQALYANTTGDGNTAIGDRSLLANTIGNYNTAIGSLALNSNIDGKYNTAVGYAADVSASLTNATAIGSGAKATVSNTIQLGDVAVTNVFAGVGNKVNTVTGNLQITGGKISTAAGVALNIEVNNEKAGRIDASLSNVFYGYQACNSTTGIRNTANGHAALYNNTTGRNNTAVGKEALYSNTTGNSNTALGFGADVLIGTLNNATAIGAGAIVNDNNKIRLGDPAVTVVEIAAAAVYTGSDGRFKTNISESDIKGLEFIKKLRPVAYNFDTKKFQAFLTQNMPADVRKEYMNKDFSSSTAIRQSGFIAQEVEKAAQEIGYDFNGLHKPESANDNYSLAYSQFVVPLVKAVQEQQQMLEAKDAEIKAVKEDLQKVNQQLQQRLEALEKLLTGNTNITKNVATKQVGIANAEDISLYPNPTTGIFTITTSNIDNGVIEIYDMAGNSMQKTTFNNAKSGYQLNVSGYAKGVYLLNIIANNKKYTKRLVIQ